MSPPPTLSGLASRRGAGVGVTKSFQTPMVQSPATLHAQQVRPLMRRSQTGTVVQSSGRPGSAVVTLPSLGETSPVPSSAGKAADASICSGSTDVPTSPLGLGDLRSEVQAELEVLRFENEVAHQGAAAAQADTERSDQRSEDAQVAREDLQAKLVAVQGEVEAPKGPAERAAAVEGGTEQSSGSFQDLQRACEELQTMLPKAQEETEALGSPAEQADMGACDAELDLRANFAMAQEDLRATFALAPGEVEAPTDSAEHAAAVEGGAERSSGNVHDLQRAFEELQTKFAQTQERFEAPGRPAEKPDVGECDAELSDAPTEAPTLQEYQIESHRTSADSDTPETAEVLPKDLEGGCADALQKVPSAVRQTADAQTKRVEPDVNLATAGVKCSPPSARAGTRVGRWLQRAPADSECSPAKPSKKPRRRAFIALIALTLALGYVSRASLRPGDLPEPADPLPLPEPADPLPHTFCGRFGPLAGPAGARPSARRPSAHGP